MAGLFRHAAAATEALQNLDFSTQLYASTIDVATYVIEEEP